MEAKSFNEHQLWSVVTACKEAADEINADALPDLPTRVRAIAELLDRFRVHAEAPLFSATMVNNMLSAWNNLKTNLEMFVQNPAGYATSVENCLDVIITQTASWPTPWKSHPLSAAMHAQLDAFSAEVTRQREDLTSQIRELTAQLELRDQEITALEKKAAALETELEDQTTNIENKFTSLSTAFDESQTTRSTAFTDWLENRKKELDSVRHANEETLDRYEVEAKRKLHEIENLQASAENVTSKVAAATMARDFGQFARNQMVAAVVSLLVGAGLIIWAGMELANTVKAAGPNVDTSWQWVALKLGLSATIVGGASVALTLGNKFLRNSTVAKRMDLELRAIGPYLADVPEDEAQKTKVAIANRAFGYVWASENGKASDDEDKISVGAAAQLFDAATKTAVKSMQAAP